MKKQQQKQIKRSLNAPHLRALRTVQRFFPQVRIVQDGRANVQVHVTEKDSSNSKLRNHAECAFAVACKRKYHADGVIISIRTAYIIKGDTAYRFKVPNSVSREVTSFDRRGGFDPGHYHLKAPSPTERLGCKITGKTHNKTDRKHNGFRHMHHTGRIRTSLKHTK